MATPRRVSELDQPSRRRALIRTTAIILVVWTLIIGLYYLVPAHRHSGDNDLIRLAVGLLLFAGFLGWQTSRIVRAELPELRAVQALGAVIPLFFVVFSSIYLSFSYSTTSTFSEPLDHTRALYFTITVFSTVGFGDITPRTDLARIVVSIQMLLDLVILGVVVRLIVTAARTGLARGQQD